MVPACSDANDVDGAVLHTKRQQGRHVLVDILSVAELVDSCNGAGLVDGRLVLHANLRAELILGCKVEFLQFVVDTHDGRKSQTSLVAQQVHPIAILLQAVEIVFGALQLCLLSQQLGGNLHTGSLILGNTGIDRVDTFVDSIADMLQVAAKVDIAVGCLHLDVADLGLIGGISVEHAQTAID